MSIPLAATVGTARSLRAGHSGRSRREDLMSSGGSAEGAGMASPPTNPLPERVLAFEYPDGMDPAWSPRRPEFAYAANAVSLIMPFAEPYFVKSVRSALPQL